MLTPIILIYLYPPPRNGRKRNEHLCLSGIVKSLLVADLEVEEDIVIYLASWTRGASFLYAVHNYSVLLRE